MRFYTWYSQGSCPPLSRKCFYYTAMFARYRKGLQTTAPAMRWQGVHGFKLPTAASCTSMLSDASD